MSNSFKSERYCRYGFALLVAMLYFMYCFLSPRIEMHDELSLYNPIYTFLEFGKMTAPASGWHDSMVIHPPVHYTIIALFIKLGFNSFMATTLPSFLMVSICLFLILFSGFGVREQISLMAGLCLPLLYGQFSVQLQAMRPDYILCLSWFSGLIALEAARNKFWDSRWLFIGSILISLSAIVHYFGIVSVVIPAIYLIVYLRKGLPKGATPAWSIVVALGLVLVPFAVFFVLPNLKTILLVVSLNQSKFGEPGVFSAIQRHFEQYHAFYQTEFMGYIFPAIFLRIPLFLFALLAFFQNVRLRTISLSALPLLLFIFMYSNGKSEGYFLEEIILYGSACSYLLFGVMGYLLKKLSNSKVISPALTVTLILGLIVIEATHVNAFLAFSTSFREHEMHLTRACVKQVHGDANLVASRSNLWYLSGATNWYDLSEELFMCDSIAEPDIASYLSCFDYLTEHNAGANYTFAKQKATLPRWYLNQLLHMKGFYLTQDNKSFSDLATIVFSPREENEITGFAFLDDRNLLELRASKTGDFVFCITVAANAINTTDFYDKALVVNQIPIIDSLGPAEQMNDQAIENLYFSIWKKEPFQEFKQSSIQNNQRLLEHHFMHAEPRNASEMIEDLHLNDQPIRFYLNKSELPDPLKNEQNCNL